MQVHKEGNKKCICLITNWFPTPENPIQGCFFKEQAIAVSEEYDHLVVHYHEHRRKHIFQKEYSVSRAEIGYGLIEYDIHVYSHMFYYFTDLLLKLKMKFRKEKGIDGIGKYVSEQRKKYIKKTITKIFQREIVENFDVLYCVDAQLEAYYLYCLSEYFHKPYIIGEHAPVPWPGTLITDANKLGIEKADAFLAISNDKIRQLMLQNIKLPRTIYIGNMIDESKFSLKDKKNDTKTFIIIAAHSYYKNYGMLISIMNRLTEKTRERFKLLVVGYAANKGYSKNIDILEEKIKQSSFSECVEMIPYVAREEISSVICRADAFVMTSIQEGQPVSVMEAACCGLPIFATRCGGVEDYIDDSMGRLYSITDIEGFADGLKDFLEERLVFDSSHIRNQVVSRFGKEAFVRKFGEVVESLVDQEESHRQGVIL